MVKYICLYCKKDFVKKSTYDYHIKSCENKFNKIINKYKLYTNENLLNEYNEVIKVSKNKNNNYTCEKCNKSYTSYNGLKLHIRTNSCEKTNLSLYEKIQKKLELTNNQQIITTNNINNTNSNNTNNINNSNNNISNNNTQNNITNNIKLVPYDEIKYDYMKESVLKNAFAIPGEAFQSITTDIFFDPDNKENHVIYCPNLKDSQIHVFNGNKFTGDGWDVLDKKKFFKEMLTKQMNTLEKIFRCNEDDDNPLEIDNIVGFTNLLKEFNKNNDVIKEYTNKLNTICYKNNSMVKNTIDETKEESKDNKIKSMLAKAATRLKNNNI